MFILLYRDVILTIQYQQVDILSLWCNNASMGNTMTIKTIGRGGLARAANLAPPRDLVCAYDCPWRWWGRPRIPTSTIGVPLLHGRIESRVRRCVSPHSDTTLWFEVGPRCLSLVLSNRPHQPRLGGGLRSLRPRG